MPRSLLSRPGGLGLALGLLLAAAFLAAGRGAVADPISCGTINPHAQIYASAQGQTPAQSTDFTDHALPWSGDLTQQSGSSSADKRIDASCQQDSHSVMINMSSSERGATDDRPNEAVRAGWAPSWATHVSLAPHQQLNIALSSSVNYLNCQLVAPGVALNWTMPYSGTVNTTAGVTDFTVALYCTSGGLHDINQKAAGGWVNGETILLNLTSVDLGRGGF